MEFAAIVMSDPEIQASKSLYSGLMLPATTAATKMDINAMITFIGRDIKKKPRHFKINRGIKTPIEIVDQI
jgi:hypothetical protein